MSARAPDSGSKRWDVGAKIDLTGGEMTEDAPKVFVQVPRDRMQKMRIELLAKYIAKDGQGLETRIIEKERANLGAWPLALSPLTLNVVRA